MKNAHRALPLVSTLARLQSNGVRRLDLLSSDGIRDLLRAELVRRMARTAAEHGQDIDALTQRSLREFTALLEEHLTGTRGGSSVLPWTSRSLQGEARRHAFFVFHPRCAAAARAAAGS